jgi:hypothetical protein
VVGRQTSGACGDGGPAADAALFFPTGVALDARHDLFIADRGNNRVRRVDGETGIISTVAGIGEAGFSGDGGPAMAAQLDNPIGVGVDASGTVFIADEFNARVRRIDGTTGIITTVAGTGTAGGCGDGQAATTAQLDHPTGVALDGSGNLFIADRDTERIRRVDGATGIITTVAGTGAAGFCGDGSQGTTAQLSLAMGCDG